MKIKKIKKSNIKGKASPAEKRGKRESQAMKTTQKKWMPQSKKKLTLNDKNKGTKHTGKKHTLLSGIDIRIKGWVF